MITAAEISEKVGEIRRWLPQVCSLVLLIGAEAFGVGESAVITLVFPWGARQNGMGEVGVALADDESALFFNPAGLDTDDPRWENGSVATFYEPILPAFGITDLWHGAVAMCYRPRTLEVGTFGFMLNYLHFGENLWTDELGRELGSAVSFEAVAGLSWGAQVFKTGRVGHSFGISAKYVHSALAPGFGPYDEGTGRTVALDAGYLVYHPVGIRAGITLANMGPSIFYISRDEADPIPFTVNAALGFSRGLCVHGVEICGLAFEYRFERELVKNYTNRRPDPFWKAAWTRLEDESWEEFIHESILHAGFETSILNTIHLRTGYLHDSAGVRFEWHHGIGASVFGHFSVDTYWIREHKTNWVRMGQWGVSFSCKRIFDWKEEDFYWWRNKRY